ncbi:hypothetical protein [Phocaeicola sp.]
MYKRYISDKNVTGQKEHEKKEGKEKTFKKLQEDLWEHIRRFFQLKEDGGFSKEK